MQKPEKKKLRAEGGNEERSLIRKVYEVIFLTVAFINLVFVFFDATYLSKIPYARITMRDFYVSYVPSIPNLYDEYKGIQPHRFTVAYLAAAATVEEKRAELEEAEGIEAFNLENEIRDILVDLEQLSHEMIDLRGTESHFYLADKEGTLEVIKNKLREHKENPRSSAIDAFSEFWSEDNILGENGKEELAYFNEEIRPLMNENYFRWIGEDGRQISLTYLIDRWFVLFFLIDFLMRWLNAIVTRQYRRWYLFPVRKWYEVFWLIPPHHALWIRIFRIVPFYFRLKESGLFPGKGILPDVVHDNAAIIAEEISGMVMVNIIDQMKGRLEKLEGHPLDSPTLAQAESMLKRQIGTVNKKVLPQVEREIVDYIMYSINRSMEPYLLSPIGPIVRLILMTVQTSIRDGVHAAMSDPAGIERMNHLTGVIVNRLFEELAGQENRQQLIDDLSDLLDRVKDDIRDGIAEQEGK